MQQCNTMGLTQQLTVFCDDNHLAGQDISDPLKPDGSKGTVL